MTDKNIELLEAEGQLNREVQAALQNFREKLLQNASPTKREAVIKPNEQKEGPEKRFKFRESLLEIMFEIKDFQTLYNMVVASFIILTFSLLYDNYVKKGEVVDMISLFQMFRGAKIVIITWLILSSIFFCIVLVTKLALRVNRYIWIPVYILHCSLNITTAMYFANNEQLGFASVVIIMCESVRMLMKSHSYIRTKVLYLKKNPYRDFQFRGIKVLNVKQGEQEIERNDKQFRINIKENDIFGQLSKLYYFFWAPTLIYRDHYILTPVRSIKKIILHFVNFLACTYYAFILYQSWVKQTIQNLEKHLDFTTLSITISNLMLPSVLFLIMGFFGFLHSWLNLWAEITRFPDRAFYSDWWNSLQFGSYYRKWNIIVHDWLYYYMYLDIYRFFSPMRKNRVIVQLITFIISAIIHEFIIFYAIGFFYPILFILFTGPGIAFMQLSTLRRRSVNLVFWLEMYIGTSMMFTLYLVQVFARQKISDEKMSEMWGGLSWLIPRTVYLSQVL